MDTSLVGTGITAVHIPTNIMINMDGATLVTIRPNGVIDYGPHYTPDAAAKVFWEALGNSMPADRTRVGELQAEISRLTENQRLQDSATAAVMERAEKAEAELAACREDANKWKQLKALMGGAHAAFLSVNEHRLSYEEAPTEGPVYLQWYPNTPVGFYIVQAETIDAALDAARKEGA